MQDALSIGATGMQAQQLNVDTIANNLVNVNTPGFKKGRVSFTDLMTLEASRQILPPSSSDSLANIGPLSPLPALGTGVGVAGVSKLFDQGALSQTGSVWDVAIQGDGFLSVSMQDGSTAYTRGGTLKVTSDGLLATQSGQPLKPGISIPANATSLSIAADGTVLVSVPNRATPVEAGQLQMARFTNPGGLTALGDGIYRASEASGEPLAGRPGEDGLGSLHQGVLEGSNVQMVDEMVNLMIAQRGYEASVKVVQTADDLLGMVNNLRK